MRLTKPCISALLLSTALLLSACEDAKAPKCGVCVSTSDCQSGLECVLHTSTTDPNNTSFMCAPPNEAQTCTIIK